MRTRMDRENRAKQFMPFAALKGYPEALRSVEQVWEPQTELSEESEEELNKKLPGLGDTVTTPDGLQGTVQSVNVLRQRVKVVVEINDEKEIQEFPVDELKFRPRKKKVKVSEQELKELQALEDKKGDSKLNE